MTARQIRLLLIVLSLAVAATRLLAAAHSSWEWDEALFGLSLHDFNVAAHHPHPPGFPLYVVLGRIARLFTSDDFHALRAVNLLAAMLVFPTTYMLSRAMRLELVPSIIAALITSFAPNVWFYGGTAFSDEPTLTLLLFGAALLLRGRESRGAYYIGCVVMAAALVMRPQNVLIVAYPWLAGSWPRWKEHKLDPIAGALIMFVIVAGFFGGAAYVTGFSQFRYAVSAHGEYVMRIDSYRNPHRDPWFRNIKEFFFDPYLAGKVSLVLGAFAAIGALRMRRPALEAIATFGPFVVFALFMLNVQAAGRYAITTMPLLGILAAEGIRVVADAIARAFAKLRNRDTSPALSTSFQFFFFAAIFSRLITWTLPALAEVREHDAPTIEACRWIRQHLDPKSTTLYIHSSMDPWAEYLLRDYKGIPVDDGFTGASLADVSRSWMIAEGATNAADGVNFLRPRGHLFNISRKRYFEVSVRPLSSSVTFGDGWYDEESDPGLVWRWMGARSTTLLAPLPGKGELALRFHVPLDIEPRKPVATVSMNGKVIDRFVCDGVVDKRWVVPSNAATPNVLTMELDLAVNPQATGHGADPRDLGLQLLRYSWRSADEP